jgi:multidrug efflux pump subunit AcrA (membrane-fusion protein)
MAVSLLPLVGVVGCGVGRADPPQEREAETVAVVQPHRADVVRSITLPGDLVGYYEAALHAKVSGYLKSIAVDKGDPVKQGEVLGEIEVPELQQKLKRARAILDTRRLTRDRLEHVWKTDKRLVAREDVDIAEGKFEQAKAEVEELEALMKYTHIVAPFDGVVTARFVDPGALIQASGSLAKSPSEGSAPSKSGAVPVVTIADISKLRVYIYVPESDASAIREGVPAVLKIHEFPGRDFTGTVTRFAKSLDLSTRTMLTEVDIENPQRELYPGMYADVSLELTRHRNALELPATAIGNTERGESFVFVVNNQALARVPVKTGIGNAAEVEIVSGLSGTEQVVRNLTPALVEGRKVRPQLITADGALPSPTDLAQNSGS